MAKHRSQQRITPYLCYEDGAAAIEFLCRAFGFDEQVVVKRGDGTLLHAELAYGGNVVRLGTPVDAFGKPKPSLRDLPERPSSLMCRVDDVDAHYSQARAAGAAILSELEDKDYGDRMYGAADPEGHVWIFTTPMPETPPEDGPR